MKDSSKRPGLSSEARNAILAQHDHLRRLVKDVSELASFSMTSDQVLEPLRTKAGALYAALDEHMRFEENLLEAALREVIGRGAELHAEVERDHQRQRAILTSAIAEIGRAELLREELVQSVRRFVDLLLRDMDAEEQVLLSAEVDALMVDGEGG